MFPFEDHKGALWLAGCEAGSEGLFYFDGIRFIAPAKDQFPKAIVRGLAEDTDGGIWIASNFGVYRFYQGKLQKKFEGAALAGITEVAPDVFLTTLSQSTADPFPQGALVRISRVGVEWKAEKMQDPTQQVYYRLDHNGHILFGCIEGYCEISVDDIVHWKPGVPLLVTRHAAQTEANAEYARNVSVVLRDRFGCVWWRGRVAAAYQCPSDPKPVNLPASLASLGFPSLFELPDGTIGFPSYGKLTLGRPGNLRVLNGSNGCPNAMMAVAGGDDSVWISSTSGLYVLPLHTKIEYWSARDGLGGTVWSVLHAGHDVFASADISSEILDSDRSHWKTLGTPGGRFSIGPENTVMAASNNSVFQMTHGGNILRRSQSLQVWLLKPAADGSEWAAGNGVYKLNPRGGSLIAQPKATDQKFIQGLETDRDGDLWTCSWSGFSHLSKSGWRTISTKDGLLQNGCGSMTEDTNGDFWYAYDRLPGFALIQNARSDHPVIQQFQNEDANSRTYFFASDRRGWLWRGTPNGLYAADLEQARQGEWLHLDRVDGLPAVDTNQNSFFEDSDGSIWFGAENSVIHLSPPDDMVRPTNAPSVFLSSFSLNSAAPALADMVSGIKSGTNVVAHVGSLQFDRRNALRLRYRLLPEDSSWKPARDLDLHLGKLAWGAHTLEVEGQLGDGPWSTSSAKSFNVLKPIWLTWPVLLAFAATGGLGFAGAREWRKRKKKRASKTFPELAEWRLAALSPEVQHLEGTRLDSRFEVGRVLARGGFALVAEGKDLQQSGRACAIKIFRQELVDKEWIAKRFQQEVMALQQISHPNVVNIYGHGTTPNGAPYLVMEFVKGKTLRELLDAGSISRAETASYLRQMGSALGEIHARGICHRDLKPENLMIRGLSRPGQDLVLIDFSIAIVKDPDETLHGLSRAAGTLYYMAPEQAIGYADASSDIYSLAKVVIEMLTGQRLSTLLPDASMDLPARVRELLAQPSFGLSQTSIDLISKALEFDPFRRPKDANDFAVTVARDLERSAELIPAKEA
jgi:tRNA A-37 threonylcarbamoyl transferase component Bud32